VILLDTHVWIWLNVDTGAVPAAYVEASRTEEIAISSVSLWETMMLIQKGRITVAGPAGAVVRSWLARNPVGVVPVTDEIAILSRSLPFEHEDPADQFIAATAFHVAAPLATLDERLRKLPWLKLV